MEHLLKTIRLIFHLLRKINKVVTIKLAKLFNFLFLRIDHCPFLTMNLQNFILMLFPTFLMQHPINRLMLT